MGSTFTLYGAARKQILGAIDLATDTVKLALVTSSYTPSLLDSAWAQVSDFEVAAVASPSNGYTAGGKELTECEVTNTATESTFDAADVTWTLLTGTFRYGVLYVVGTKGGVVNPLLGYVLYDSTPSDININAVDWTTQWNGNGIITC